MDHFMLQFIHVVLDTSALFEKHKKMKGAQNIFQLLLFLVVVKNAFGEARNFSLVLTPYHQLSEKVSGYWQTRMWILNIIGFQERKQHPSWYCIPYIAWGKCGSFCMCPYTFFVSILLCFTGFSMLTCIKDLLLTLIFTKCLFIPCFVQRKITDMKYERT